MTEAFLPWPSRTLPSLPMPVPVYGEPLPATPYLQTRLQWPSDRQWLRYRSSGPRNKRAARSGRAQIVGARGRAPCPLRLDYLAVALTSARLDGAIDPRIRVDRERTAARRGRSSSRLGARRAAHAAQVPSTVSWFSHRLFRRGRWNSCSSLGQFWHTEIELQYRLQPRECLA